MKEISFIIDGDPVAKGRPRFRRIGNYVQTYTPAKTKNAEKHIEECFKKQVNNFKMPEKGPISLTIEFFMPIPTSLSKKKKDALLGQPHTKKPDLDNFCKSVCDALNGIAWEDDSCIYDMRLIKVYAAEPSTHVTIVYE